LILILNYKLVCQLEYFNMNNKGFTIIESLIAIAILTVSITGATSIVQTSLQNAANVKLKGQAVGLAVEGAEYVQNLYDQSVAAGEAYSPGSVFYDFVSVCENGCEFETGAVSSAGSVLPNSYAPCNANCVLQITDTGYQYAPANGSEDSIYERFITVTPRIIDSSIEFKVETDVSYTLRGNTESVNFESYQYVKYIAPPEE